MKKIQNIQTGLLDLCLDDGSQPHEHQIRDSITLAIHAERLGFSSIWYGEHHETAFHASPLLMASQVLNHTKHVLVGTAGILASFYSPLEIVAASALLSCTFPKRFELGLARGKTTGEKLSLLLDHRPAIPSDLEYFAKIQKVIALLDRESVAVKPAGTKPRVWLLGANKTSARYAGTLGVCYCHAAFLTNSLPPEEALHEYLTHYGIRKTKPEFGLACSILHSGNSSESSFNNYPALQLNISGNRTEILEQLNARLQSLESTRIIFLLANKKLTDKLQTLEQIIGFFD